VSIEMRMTEAPFDGAAGEPPRQAHSAAKRRARAGLRDWERNAV